MKDDILIDVSRETIVLLQRLGLLVEKWNKSINLISQKTVQEIWNRHILDSAQIFYANNRSFTKWLDMGSGAGFPGLVVAILAQDKNIGGETVLVESDKRKCVFLRSFIFPDLFLSVHRVKKVSEVLSFQKKKSFRK